VKKSPVSLKDIAKELNLSISTVSRAIRNTGEISPATRKAVLDLAEKWSYKPNPLAMGY
jgi:LacI family transcriptional regulator